MKKAFIILFAAVILILSVSCVSMEMDPALYEPYMEMGYTKREAEAIVNHNWCVGMSVEALIFSKGEPVSKGYESARDTAEAYKYDAGNKWQIIYVKDGECVSCRFQYK